MGYSFELLAVPRGMRMELGVSFPMTELGSDLPGVRSFAMEAEELGYKYIRILDHVLGAHPQFHPEVERLYYDHQSYTHEPLILMGYLAAVTERLRLVTGILILPQRQTALVAKQAAEVDVLSRGRLTLGIGVGWNPVEYEALGQDFRTRGRRYEEQIAVLRALWTQEVVDFKGDWHRITHAGINPLPVQRPIPIWIGAGVGLRPIPSDSILRRIARVADGWFPIFEPDEAGRETISRVRRYAEEAGRDPAAIGMEGRISLSTGGPDDWVREGKAWEEAGATHVGVQTVDSRFKSPEQHIAAIRRFKEAWDR